MATGTTMQNEQLPEGSTPAPGEALHDGNPAADPDAAHAVAPAAHHPAAHHKVDWVAEVRSIALLLLAVLAFHSFIAKPFYIPSESMMPVLLKGDRLVVSKYPYGWSYVSPSFHPLPFLKGRIFGTLPERGDIVIVTPRNTREDYIKRVIGLPGDIIEVRAGQILINNVPVPQYTLPVRRVPVDADAPCPAFQFPGALVHGDDGRDYCELPVRREVLPNGKTYEIIDVGPSALDWSDPVRVPAGHLFLMGDNRDNSADSRATLAERGLGGPVPFESIGGRAEFITFSLNGSTTWNPLTWINSLRSGRAGASLRTPLEHAE